MVKASIEAFYPENASVVEVAKLFENNNNLLETATNFAKSNYTLCKTQQGANWFYKLEIEEKTSLVKLGMRDCPFIIDSILLFANKINNQILNIIHFPIFLSRSENGAVGEVFDMESKTSNSESVVFFKFKSPINRSSILKELENIVMAIFSVVSCWKDMRSTIKNISSSLKIPQNADTYKTNAEVQKFLQWLLADNFILCGIAYMKHDGAAFAEDKSKALGICQCDKHCDKFYDGFLKDCHPSTEQYIAMEIKKSRYTSIVYKEACFDVVKLQDYNEAGRLLGEWEIYGIFTTKAYKEEVTKIPLIQTWIANILDKTKFLPHSYNYKEIVSFANSIPRDLLFKMNTEELYNTAVKHVKSRKIGENIIFVKNNNNGIYDILLCINSQPSHEIKNAMIACCEKLFGEDIFFEQISNSDLNGIIVRITANTDKKITEDSLCNLKQKLLNICQNWDFAFKSINTAFSCSIFSENYKADVSHEEASLDAEFINKLLFNQRTQNSIESVVREFEDKNENKFKITIFIENKDIDLSSIVSILNNFGFAVEDSSSFKLNGVAGKVITIKKIVVLCNNSAASIERLTQNFCPLLNAVIEGEVENGILNSLSVSPSIASRDIVLFKAIVRYMQQIQFPYTIRVISEIIGSNANYIKAVLQYFYTKLDPNFKGECNLAEIEKQISVLAKSSGRENDERAMRVFFQVVKAIVRTNFFLGKDYISIKLHPHTIENMPKPVPFAEIFVYHSEFEALHLRVGKVARGGLRWSDRIEDYRTEVLGLVKAQNVKNAVIVPVGSKGGFVIKKDCSTMSRDEFFECGKHYYKKFISACLDITDNIVDGKVVHPNLVVPSDGEDPYFVVAADKGTATFSDIANSVSLSYKFWLGDAFASGGSNGYDHKKMGITAKGGWVAVKRHFMELGINPEKDEITVVGIGDMSGDVFGNGLLRSKTIKMIAAFNHLHIFVDPTPNPAKSFAERERMFNLPRSSWTDYSKSALSEGTMIYARNEKILKLTPQIKALFGIEAEEITPNELISTILKHKADLLWNGGIGTYIKASTERNIEVGDKANDAIRINGCELGAKVIGEGGNLGFTQLGRIEAAKAGVMLNTDAMDNSAGVDCSDHEVNIKITLNSLVVGGKISLEERNEILAKMTDDVDYLVLRDNYEQTQAISVSYRSKTANLDRQAKFIKFLEKENFLDRENEFLPSNDEIKKRKSEKSHLTRPELCVLFGYSKMYLYSKLLADKTIDDEYFNEMLLKYFPPLLAQKFKADLLSHKLKREIIATCLTNKTINRVGITFIHSLSTQTGRSFVDIVKALTIASDILGIDKIWEKIEDLDFKCKWAAQLSLFEKVINYLEVTILWILSSLDLSSTSISAAIEKYKLSFTKAVGEISLLVAKTTGDEDELFSEINLQLANFKFAQYALFAAKYGKQADVSPLIKTIFAARDLLNFESISEIEASINHLNESDKIAHKTIATDIMNNLTQICLGIVDNKTSFEAWSVQNAQQIEMFNSFVADVKISENKGVSNLFLISNKLKQMLK